ncbi:MAG: SEL1-like repeat protein [Candidatus Hydrogenedentes bacterium]|nr:SEL1-like repeat protein [Candidatus Hydrogenedentota bacterium]
MFNWAETMVGLSYVPALLLKATVLLGCVWCAHKALCRCNPRWRVLLWRATLVALIVLPVAEWALPRFEVAVVQNSTPPPPVRVPVMIDSPLAMVETYPQPLTPMPLTEPLPIERPSQSFNVWAWIADHFGLMAYMVWTSVLLMFLAGIARAWHNLRALIARSVAAPAEVRSLAKRVANELGVRVQTEVRVVEGRGSPFLTGIRQPVIVLPARCLVDSDTVQLRAVLAHEMAHVKTWDPFWMAFARVTASLLWFHPLAWRLRSVHNSACEDVCDGVAAAYLGSFESYSKALAREALALFEAQPVPGGVPMLHSAEIVHRLRKIQRGIQANPLARRWVAASLLAGLTLLVTLGSLQLVQAQPKATPEATPSVSSPATLPDEILLKWAQNDAAECKESRDRLGLPDVYLIAREKDRLPLWREAAQRGMPEGQVLLALCHAHGAGAENDPLTQNSLLQAAIAQGDVSAMYYYANVLFQGDGVTPDIAAAVGLYVKAAAAGDRAAMWQLGSLYGNGHGVQKDLAQSHRWLEMSAIAGAPYAMFQLGQAYFSGDLGPQDEALARKWIAQAAELGCPFGIERLRQLGGHAPYMYPPEFVPPSDVARSPFGPPKETPELPAVDPAATREAPSPASLSDADLIAEVEADEQACRECRDRTGYSKVYIQLHASWRLPLWQEAANRGMAAGQVMVGLCYTAMIGFGKDDVKRTELFKAAAEQGDPTGMHNYASSLQGGIGVEPDLQEAFNWWKKAADLGEPSGMWHIAEFYRRGQYVERDTDTALDWYLRAADAGSAEAKYQLGLAFMAGGDMVPRSVADGRRWLAMAAEGGFPKAVNSLRETRQGQEEHNGLLGFGAATETPPRL